MKKNYNFFQKFIVSGFYPQNYKHFLKLPIGKSIRYILILSVVLSLFSVIRPLNDVDSKFKEVNEKIIKEIPEFSIEDGKINVDKKLPIIVEIKDEVIILSDTDIIDNSLVNKYNSAMIITGSRFIEKTSNGMKIRDILSNFNKNLLINTFQAAKYLSIFVVLTRIITFFIIYILFALIIASTGMLINRKAKTYFAFSELYNLSLYSMTMSIIIKTVLDILYINQIIIYGLYFVISLIYLYRSIYAIKVDESNPIGW